MANTLKESAPVNTNNVMAATYNSVDKSLSTSGFVVAKVGRKITQTIATTSLANDTLLFDHLENGVSLYVLKVVYLESNRTTLLSVERIS